LTGARREPLVTGAFLRLWTFSFVTFFSAFQLFPAIPFRILELGGTKTEAGLFLTLYTWACAASAPFTGAVADHFGRRRALLAGGFAFAVFSILYGEATGLPLLVGVAVVHGVFWSALLSASGAMMSEVIPASRRTEGIAWWGLASTVAIAVAPLVGLTLYRAAGWRVVCGEMALLSLAMAFVATRLPPGEPRRSGRFPSPAKAVEWRVIVTALSLSAVSFGYGGVMSYVALLSIERKIEPPSLFFTLFAASILVTRVFAGRLGDRFGPKWLLFPSLALVPFALALVAVAESKALLISAALLYGFGFGGTYPAFVTWVLGRTDTARRAATFGSVLFAFDTGIGAGSMATGFLATRFGFGPAFFAAAAVSLLAIPVFLATSRLLPERTDETVPSALPAGGPD